MKNKKVLFSGLLVLMGAALIVGLTQISQAAETSVTKTEKPALFGDRGRGQMMQAQNGSAQGKMMTEAERATHQESIEAAINANDYAAWLTAVGANCPLAEKITKDNFAKFVEAHQLRQSADSIMEELGVEKGGRGFGHASRQIK